MSRERVAVLDYGVGNLRNVLRALETVGAEPFLATDAAQARGSGRMVLPGVGAFGDSLAGMRSRGFDELVHAQAKCGNPVLGICVGFQALFQEGLEFGRHPGLGLLQGQVVRFGEDLVVPHVGWNSLEFAEPAPLLAGIAPGAHVYFVHSYRVEGASPVDVVASCDYGGSFPAIVQQGSVAGMQFHPEKSQAVGLRLLSNWLAAA